MQTQDPYKREWESKVIPALKAAGLNDQQIQQVISNDLVRVCQLRPYCERNGLHYRTIAYILKPI